MSDLKIGDVALERLARLLSGCAFRDVDDPEFWKHAAAGVHEDAIARAQRYVNAVFRDQVIPAPAEPRAVVTEAQVEAAIEGWFAGWKIGDGAPEHFHRRMRAAIESATPPRVDRVAYEAAVKRFERTTTNLSGWGWDYEARIKAGAEHEAAKAALDALLAPVLGEE